MKSDSRDNIVQKLKRELRKLKEENLVLKQQLGSGSSNSNGNVISYTNGNSHSNSGRLPKINSTRNGI